MGGALTVSFGAGLLVGGPGTVAGVSTEAVLFAGLVAAGAGALHGHRRRHESRKRRSLARRQTLDDLSAALPSATAPAVVYRLAAEAAAALLGEYPDARAQLLAPSPDDPASFAVVTEAGAADGPTAETSPTVQVPAGLLARLTSGELISGTWSSILNSTGLGSTGLNVIGSVVPAGALPDGRVPGAPRRRESDAVPTGHDPGGAGPGLGGAGLDGSGSGPTVTLLPLLGGGHFFGALCVVAGRELPSELLADLRTLQVQVSLALHAATLATELALGATRDPLTGLGNRSLLRDTMTAALGRARRTGRPVGVLLLDVNRFRRINELYGHDAGDELLKLVADRLRACVRTADTVGRLGGDQFVVVAEDLRAAQDVIVIAERVLTALDRNVAVGSRVVRATISAGIALSHAGTHTADELLRDAGAAMGAAKEYGDGRYQVHGAVPARS